MPRPPLPIGFADPDFRIAREPDRDSSRKPGRYEGPIAQRAILDEGVDATRKDSDPLLSDQQELFAIKMAKLWRVKDAAAEMGISLNLARKLNELPAVQGRIAWIRKEAFKRERMDADEALAQLARIARFDPSELVHESGRMKQLHELGYEAAQCLESFEFDYADGDSLPTISKVKVARMEALKMIARNNNLFAEEAKSGAEATMAMIALTVDAARRRVAEAQEREIAHSRTIEHGSQGA